MPELTLHNQITFLNEKRKRVRTYESISRKKTMLYQKCQKKIVKGVKSEKMAFLRGQKKLETQSDSYALV